ncbi:hypothetical protein V1J52_07330 [Streptomyces sp. TRM 70351]|uniref:hypothetical protein n=1 Tax=Streptomyces sp. TRM 70351 TaxID=3116552 RepID=UPI002E7AFDE4|nr:hypothetical protein [Streptomyces sp. TRM 70351]MEE1928008.1 hypothetical protein [Streptomyces sp. TRM 70351]
MARVGFWTDDEYCLYVNAVEGSTLWMILADRSDSEDEDEWVEYAAIFSPLTAKWARLGYVKLMRGVDWPIDLRGEVVPDEEIESVLADPLTWKYSEDGQEQVCIILGDVNIVDSL